MLHNPSDNKIELLGVQLHQPPTEGAHGCWSPADRLVLSAKRGSRRSCPSLYQGKAVKQRRVDEQGVVDVL